MMMMMMMNNTSTNLENEKEDKNISSSNNNNSFKKKHLSSGLFLYQTPSNSTTCFFYEKPSETWSEAFISTVKFYWETSSLSMRVNAVNHNNHHAVGTATVKSIDHYVDINVPLPKNVLDTQSWVFRASPCGGGSVDVICLQFASKTDTASFIHDFEKNRLWALKESKSARKSMTNALAQLSLNTSSSSSSSSSGGGGNNDSLISTKQQLDEQLESGIMSTPDKTKTMRRRLTIKGETPTIDGHENGARMQPAAEASPAKSVGKSLRRSTSSHHSKAVSFSGICRKGYAPYNPDKQNQDAMVMHKFPVNQYSDGEILFCVFDGHGENGHIVSQYFKNRIPQLLGQCERFRPSVMESLKTAIRTSENEIISNQRVNTTLSGTTAVITLIRDDNLIVANIGDSRIIRASMRTNPISGISELKAFEVSEDHKPDLPREKERIESRGGRVFAIKYDDGIDGPARVWLSDADMPGLAMSRSLCDTIGKDAGVISEPDLYSLTITPEDKFIIIASDGLWEFVSNEEAVGIAQKYIIGKETPDPQGAIKELIEESTRRWKIEEPVVDDTTIIIACFV